MLRERPKYRTTNRCGPMPGLANRLVAPLLVALLLVPAPARADESAEPAEGVAPEVIDITREPYRSVSERLTKHGKIRVVLEGEDASLLLVRPRLMSEGVTFDRGRCSETGRAIVSPVDFDRVREIRARGSFAGPGARLGAVIGAVGLGVGFGAISSMDFGFSDGGSSGPSGGAVILGVLVGGGVGALLGASVGGLIPRSMVVYRRGTSSTGAASDDRRARAVLGLREDGRPVLAAAISF